MPSEEHPTSAGGRPTAADALALVRRGAAVVTGTSDESLRPRIARAWGPELVAPDGPLRLCVESGTPSHAPAQLSAGTSIAITFTLPCVPRSIQAKGVVDELGPPSEAQLRHVDAHWLAYMTQAELVGISPRLVGRLIEREALVSVTVALDELADQATGPRWTART